MNENELGKALESLIGKSNDALEDAARAAQNSVVNELIGLIRRQRKGLIVDDNYRVIITGKDGAENRRRIAEIKADLNRLIIGTPKRPGFFQENKERYLEAFRGVEKFQSAYYQETFKKFQKRPVSEITKSAQTRTAELISGGLNDALYQPVTRVLDSALSGATLKDIEAQARQELETTFTSKRGKPQIKKRGTFDSYTTRLVRDTLNNFSGNVTQAVTASLGLEWIYYSKGEVASSRDFCKERDGNYFHIDEVRSWASMDWEGKNPNTNESNILAMRGGYNCMHSWIPVSKDQVPSQSAKGKTKANPESKTTPVQAQDSQAWVLPKTPEEAIKRGKNGIDQARKLIGKDGEKVAKIQNELDSLYTKNDKILKKVKSIDRNIGRNYGDQDDFDKLIKERRAILGDRTAIIDKIKKLNTEKKKIGNKYGAKIQEMFLSSEGMAIDYAAKKGLKWDKKYGDWFGEFTRFMGPNFTAENSTIELRGTRRKRAFASMDGSRSNINIYSGVPKATFMHELGHAIENQNKDLNGLVASFLQYRAGGEQLKSLKSLTGVNYARHEKAWKDEFLQPYMGKYYPERRGIVPNEVFTMFLTYLYQPENMVLMLEKDPEYFQFFHGIFGN